MVDSPEKISQLAQNYKTDVMLVVLGDRSKAIEQTIEKTFDAKFSWLDFSPTDPNIPDSCLCKDRGITITADLLLEKTEESPSQPEISSPSAD